MSDPVSAAPSRIEAVYPLTTLQQGMVYHSLRDDRPGAYLVQWVIDLRGPLDADALRRAWGSVIRHHAVLRTAIPMRRRDRPLQAVRTAVDVPWTTHDWTTVPESARDAHLAAWLTSDRARGIDLARAPLFRLALCAWAPEAHQIIWTCHHVLLDGWSSSIVLRDVLTAYRAWRAGRSPVLPAARPFREFVQWTERQDQAAAESYWRDALADYPGPCPLTIGRKAGDAFGNELCEWSHRWSSSHTRDLARLAASHRLTEPALLAAVFLLALTRITGRRAASCGLTVSGRPPALAEAERMVGLFIATVPLGCGVEDLSQPAASWAADLQRRMGGAQAHAWTPPHVLRRAANAPEGVPLFEPVFVFENYPDADDTAGGSGDPLQVHVREAVEDPGLSLTCVVAPGDTLRVRLLFDAARLDAHVVAELGTGICDAIDRWLARPAATVGDLAPWLVDHSVPLTWQGPLPGLPDAGLWAQVEAVASAHPDRVAVEGALTYRELLREVETVAGALAEAGVGPGARVGILAERGAGFAIAMLAVLRQGGAYVPLAPEYPPDRLAWMTDDAGLALVLVDGAVPEWLNAPARAIDALRRWQGAAPPAVPAGLGWPAYVMYTSGSTGRPKGVVIPQRAVTRLIAGDTFISLAPGCRVAWASSVSFDASTLEIWGALLRGGTLVVMPRETMLDVERLARVLSESQLDLLWLSAGLFHAIARQALGALANVRQVMAGGDALRAWAVTAVLAEGRPGVLLNGYGPTENTTFSTTCDLTRLDRPIREVPIGGPIGHSEVYILDSLMRPVPAGEVGEIHVGGAGLADGYWRRPGLTAGCFVPHPFSAVPGARLYRTGDWGRWGAPGVVLFDGRRDGQVKVRGFRVEVGEVEAAIRQVRGIEDAVVVPQTGAGEELTLAAFVIERLKGAAAHVAEALTSTLPEPWRPSRILVVETFPLTANGKVDRQALLAADASAATVPAPAYQRPLSMTEQIVAALWSDVLSQSVESADADFFALGGHSLLATVVISRIREAFNVDLPLQAVFDAPRLAGLAARIDAARLAGDTPVPPPSPQPRDAGPLPLSFAQQRLWFLDRFAPLSAAYHIPHALRLSGPLDHDALQQALGTVIARHESLRTTFAEVGGQPTQVVHPPGDVIVPVIDLPPTGARDPHEWLASRLRAESERPFDLARGPLWRVTLFRVTPDDHVLSVTLHHIVADGWSIGLLSRELAEAYRAARECRAHELPPLPLQYPDFAIWQRRLLEGEARASQLDYWTARLADAVPAELPSDVPRPPTQSFRGRSLPVSLPADLSQAVRDFARRHDATPYMVLQAAFLAVLYRYTGQHDLTVGTPVANRHHAALEPLIGFFVNMLAIRVAIDPAKGFADLVGRVRRHAVEAFDRQDLPFEMLVEAVRPVRDPSRPPLVQITMAVHNVPIENLDLADVTVAAETSDLEWVRFDLELHLWDRSDGLQGYWAWATDLYDAATITDLHRHFVALLAAGLRDSRRAVSRLPMLDHAERRYLVEDCNHTAAEPPTRLVHHEVAARALEEPSAVAVIQGRETLTRRALEDRADRLARRLRARGVRPDDRVGLALDRSIDWVVAMLAVVKAGAAYVALDMAWPQVRRERVLEEAGARVVVTSDDMTGLSDGDADAMLPPLPAVTDGRLGAYVISTSGSTGHPKAVLVPHAALANHMAWMQRVFPLHADDRVFHKTVPTFDAAVWECWAPLMAGVPLVLPEPGRHGDPRHLVETMQAHGVTVLQMVPSLLRLLLDVPGVAQCRRLRRLFVGGESLTADLVDRIRASLTVEIVNLYGPAEATIDATAAVLPPASGQSIPIGRPIDNMSAYVLDDALEVLPAGVPGELYLAGAGLARGYAGQPGFTADRFVPDPFSQIPGARMYRTGDRARWRRDGQLEYLGRRDDQVKIRGQRVELGEVEAALATLPGVAAAAAAVRTDEGEPRLVAYLVPGGAGASDRASEAEARVADWQALYEVLYRNDSNGHDEGTQKASFDTTGWTSSYSGQPLPADQMRRWRDATIDRLRALAPSRVLEIGCGTGLLLFELAPTVSAYRGVDFSAPVIARLSRDVASRGWPHVDVAVARADSAWSDGQVADLMILNSVVQYFPDVGYLTRVLTEAIDRTAPGGAVFVGDVRSLPLLEAFHTGVQAARATGETTRSVLARRVEQACRREEELVLDPRYFQALAARLPRVAGVQIRPKPFDDDNELARYRYDVVFELDVCRAPHGDPPVRMEPIPAGRVARDVALLAWLRAAGGAATLGDWLSSSPQAPVDADATHVPVLTHDALAAVDLSTLANDPLPGRIARARTPEWRQTLEARLPAALVPQVFVCLDRLPLTAGGKVDRRALPVPDRDGLVSRATLARPATPAEHAIEAIWRTLLDVEQVGVHDDFFAAGGHSLLVVMLASAIAARCGVDPGVPALFTHTTIAAQARLIEQLGVRDTAPVGGPLPGGRGPLVFAFPPLLGVGLAFQVLARHLPAWTLWAFDVPDVDDPVERCAAEIQRVQPEGDITMLAYSAGGVLAFAVTQRLEARGRRVRQLVGLDAVLVERGVALDAAQRAALVEENLRHLESVAVGEAAARTWLQTPGARQRLARTMDRYLALLDALPLHGRITADVVLLEAADARPGDGRLDWRDWTTGRVDVWRGHGAHLAMAIDPDAARNAALVARCLRG